jgi:hypothetical protein
MLHLPNVLVAIVVAALSTASVSTATGGRHMLVKGCKRAGDAIEIGNDDEALGQVQCCLGDGRCARKDYDFGGSGACLGNEELVTYAAAEAICTTGNSDGHLCSVEETFSSYDELTKTGGCCAQGCSGDGKLTWTSDAVAPEPELAPGSGQFVRIDSLVGDSPTINLGEIDAFDSQGNLLTPTGFEMSEAHQNFAIERCFDNDADTYCHSAGSDPWFRIEFGSPVHKVVVTNRADCCRDRIDEARIAVTTDAEGGQVSWSAPFPTESKDSYTFRKSDFFLV